MPVFALDESLVFPPVHLAEPDGLLALGGDLSIERLLLAYYNGIFPWYESEHILWWSPDPRFVLFPAEIKISHSMKQLLKKNAFGFTINQAFTEVIQQCKTIQRKNQDSTWITADVQKAYVNMFESGYALSAESWLNGELAGGLYGIKLGNAFFGESMFSKVSNASKYAFIKLVNYLKQSGVQLIDCQVYTPYLESLGARMIPRSEFMSLLKKYL